MSWFLDQMCISTGFINSFKDFEKFWKLADFRPKNDHLACCTNRFFATWFSTENVSSLWKMILLLSKLVYMYPKISSTIFCEQNFLSSSWKKLGVSWTSGAGFGDFWLKMAPKVHETPIFSAWTQKIKILFAKYCRGYLGYMYTNFGSDRSIFHRLDTFSVENRVAKTRFAQRAKWSFFGQKSANFQKFSKSF